MPEYFGIDTSNYTTSVAIYNSETNSVEQYKKLLPVKKGELGIRQSDALFHHVKQLPDVISQLFVNRHDILAVGVSVRPRNCDGSYMPCFLAGESYADSISAISKCSVYKTSHQVGHILAALYSCNKLEYIKKPFIAFHVSGGTTDCLYVEPDNNDIIKISMISSSLDLKAGQAVDRVGLMLGLTFPCGKQLEELAIKSDKKFKIKPTMKNMNCCLSGIENKCRDMLDQKESDEDIARFCLEYISTTIEEMTKRALLKYGELPLVYAGGVMSNSIIRQNIKSKFNCEFAEPEYSCDNATGVAVYAYLKEK